MLGNKTFAFSKLNIDLVEFLRRIKMKEKIVLIGGGGHCHSVDDVLEQTNKYEIIGIVDIKKNIGKKF